MSDYTTLASHSFKDRSGKLVTSQLILSVSNWHFCRDTQALAEAPACTLNNLLVTIKLSSSSFACDKPVSASSASKNSGTLAGDEEYSFDRNGAMIPYEALLSLLADVQFSKFMDGVRSEFEKIEGAILAPSPDGSVGEIPATLPQSFRETDEEAAEKTDEGKRHRVGENPEDVGESPEEEEEEEQEDSAASKLGKRKASIASGGRKAKK
jgi:hypothetical protein